VLPVPAGRLEGALHARRRVRPRRGATTSQNWGPLFREQLRGHVRFLAKHRGLGQAERARRLLLASLRLRGIVFPGARGRTYKEAAHWLAATSTRELLETRA